MTEFWEQFHLTPETRVLDIGGNLFNWKLLPIPPQLTILNLPMNIERGKQANWLVADGKYLPFKDKAFDIVYSNSTIEHLGDFGNQSMFAAECRRVGLRYYVQTPNKWFLVEPHLITPFIHWMPRRMQKLLLRNFTIWGLVTRPTRQACNEFMQEIRLLDDGDLTSLFPDSEIWHERFLGLVKSLIAVTVDSPRS